MPFSASAARLAAAAAPSDCAKVVKEVELAALGRSPQRRDYIAASSVAKTACKKYLPAMTWTQARAVLKDPHVNPFTGRTLHVDGALSRLLVAKATLMVKDRAHAIATARKPRGARSKPRAGSPSRRKTGAVTHKRRGK